MPGATVPGKMSQFFGFISNRPAGPSLRLQQRIVAGAMTQADADLNKHVYIKLWQTSFRFFNPGPQSLRVKLWLFRPKCGRDTSFWDVDLWNQKSFRDSFLPGTPLAATGVDLAPDNPYITGLQTGPAGGAFQDCCVAETNTKLAQLTGTRGERLSFLYPNLRASVDVQCVLNSRIKGGANKRVKIKWKLPYKGEIQPRKVGAILNPAAIAAEEWVYPAECGMFLLQVLAPIGAYTEQEVGNATSAATNNLPPIFLNAGDQVVAPKPRAMPFGLRWLITEKVQFRTVGDSMPSFYIDKNFTSDWSDIAAASALAGVTWTIGHRAVPPWTAVNDALVPASHTFDYVRRGVPGTTAAGVGGAYISAGAAAGTVIA